MWGGSTNPFSRKLKENKKKNKAEVKMLSHLLTNLGIALLQLVSEMKHKFFGMITQYQKNPSKLYQAGKKKQLS